MTFHAKQDCCLSSKAVARLYSESPAASRASSLSLNICQPYEQATGNAQEAPADLVDLSGAPP
jgi:hypothetical protein